MVEMHSWITLRESYKATDEENFEIVLNRVNKKIERLKYSNLQIKVINGEYFIEFSLYANHMSPDVKELISFFRIIGNIAEGSYGLLYIYDDEDKRSFGGFRVYRLARGKVRKYSDNLLSPIVPIIEDLSN